MRSRIIFIVLLVVAIGIRFYLLGKVPAGVTNDEARYIYSAFSIWKTGHDFAGKFLPLTFNLDYSFSPVPIYILAPFVGLFSMNLFIGRLPFALAGVGSVVLIYYLMKLIFRRNDLALITMAIAAVSPWNMFFSRVAYEAVLVLFFYLLGTILFVKGLKKGTLLWSLLPFLLGFYSYHATKVFFFFYIPFLLWLYRRELRKHKTTVIAFVVGVAAIVLSFLWVMRTQGVTQTDVLIWNDVNRTVNTINSERDRNTAPFFLRSVFSNKPLYFYRVFRENYLEAISPQFLFLYGETSGLAGIYGIMSHGEFYLIDIPLFLAGIYFLIRLKNNRLATYFLIGGLLISPLPSAVGTYRTYGVRSFMMQPFMFGILAYGAYVLHTSIKGYRRLLTGVLIALYAVFVTSYLYEYFYRFPIYYAESWFGSTKDVIAVIDKNKNSYSKIIIAAHGDPLFQYAFYHSMDPLKLRNLLNQPMPRTVDNITFIDECYPGDDPKTFLPSDVLYIVPDKCYKNATPLFIIRDRGEPLRTIWKSYVAAKSE